MPPPGVADLLMYNAYIPFSKNNVSEGGRTHSDKLSSHNKCTTDHSRMNLRKICLMNRLKYTKSAFT